MRLFPRCVSGAAAALVLLTGCGDSPTAPAALVPAGELEAALSIAARLPTFPVLAARALEEAAGRDKRGPGSDSIEAATRLLRSARDLALAANAATDRAEAARLRTEAYATGLAPLALLLDPAGIEQAMGEATRWLGIAEQLVGQAELPGTREPLLAARALLRRARTAAAAGDHPAAVAALVAAADRLDETTPRSVLRRLLPELEADLAAQRRAQGEITDRRLERAERLIRGAREAYDRGEHVLGLRRAYYARQLLRSVPSE
ncbi:MAG TPA: hypothetical protein VIL18_05705 [Longimicrobiales bacterium]